MITDKTEATKHILNVESGLKDCSDNLKDDFEFVKFAILKDKKNYEYISNRLKDDYDLALITLEYNNNGITDHYSNFSENLKKNKELATKALIDNPDNYAYYPEELKKDLKLSELAISLEERNFWLIPKDFFLYKEIINNLLRINPYILEERKIYFNINDKYYDELDKNIIEEFKTEINKIFNCFMNILKEKDIKKYNQIKEESVAYKNIKENKLIKINETIYELKESKAIFQRKILDYYWNIWKDLYKEETFKSMDKKMNIIFENFPTINKLLKIERLKNGKEAIFSLENFKIVKKLKKNIII